MSNRITRRGVLQGAGLTGLAALAGISVPRMAFAAPATGDARFVVVLLRGALDGLAAAPPVGDADYQLLRGESPQDANVGTRLDDLFALHPSLVFLGEQWQQHQLTLLHAMATPYRERSHFDAQDVLETGRVRPHASQSGWLNRALAGLPQADRRTSKQAGVALGATVPLLMRGPAEVASWSPSRLPHLEEDTLLRLGDLYAGDPVLARRLADATAAQDLAGDGEGMGARGNALLQLGQAVRTAAGFLVREDGPRIAVLETTGWDTHANQAGALASRLTALDGALRTLHTEMGEAWQRTVVMIVTEFGRTVAVNGTRGTDHGTGAAGFLVGGAVRGRVLADWPGLSGRALHEGRDLAPTLDLRAVSAAVLRDHLGMSERYLSSEVFPDAGKLAKIDGLIA